MATAKKTLQPGKTNTAEKQILAYMKDHGTSWTWLAGKVNCSIGHLQFVLKGKGSKKRTLTPENLEKINIALDQEFKQPSL